MLTLYKIRIPAQETILSLKNTSMHADIKWIPVRYMQYLSMLVNSISFYKKFNNHPHPQIIKSEVCVYVCACWVGAGVIVSFSGSFGLKMYREVSFKIG